MQATSTHRFRSFVGRNGRQTVAQVRAYTEGLPIFGLPLQAGMIDFTKSFGTMQPCFIEIGFGLGQSLLALAKENPQWNFIGVETHKPGIGAVLHGIKQYNLNNIRLYHYDVVEVLEQCIPSASLAGVQIFFPDPWPKRRHHPRRLIQTDFVKLVTSKLIRGAQLHLATDWEDYAAQMMKVLSQEEALSNTAGAQQFSSRSIYRPIQTKFEQRAIRAGSNIWELQFQKI